MQSVTATPDFVPHEAWDQFAWLVPHETGKEPWFYRAFRNKRPNTRRLPSDPNFMKTVDPELQPLVGWLHSRGVTTGPSCSGHDINKRGFHEIYAGLERDATKIKTAGLTLQDPENGRDYVMQDNNYQLPWGSFDSFRKVANQHQPVGWLPFYTTDLRAGLALGTGPGFEIKETAPDMYGIRTTGENPDAWRLASDVLHRALS